MEVAFKEISRWILPAAITPPSIKGILVLIILASVWLMIFSLYQKKKKLSPKNTFITNLPTFPCLLIIFILTYVILLLIIISFFDARLYPTSRILLPTYIFYLILFITLLQDILNIIDKTRLLRILLICFYCTLTGTYIIRGIVAADTIHNNGKGYSSNQWRNSAIIEKIRKMPSDAVIYSNGPDAIYILTGRKNTYFIPQKVNNITLKLKNNYDSELLNMKKKIQKNNGILVYFKQIRWRWYIPNEEELIKKLPLKQVVNNSSESIYKVKNEN
jgi:hypothetical protein